MQEVVKQSVKTSQIPLNWKKEESVYTGYHLIDAYLKGKQDGKDEMILRLQYQRSYTLMLQKRKSTSKQYILKRKE